MLVVFRFVLLCTQTAEQSEVKCWQAEAGCVIGWSSYLLSESSSDDRVPEVAVDICVCKLVRTDSAAVAIRCSAVKSNRCSVT
jgi:hypothetical protein